MPVDAIVGLQWGDEGKGKAVDLFAENYDYVVRGHGGANAGHTAIVGRKRVVTHLVPTAFRHPKVTPVMGSGMVVHLPSLTDEICALERARFSIMPRLKISDRCHVVLGEHVTEDTRRESDSRTRLGTTKRGMGPAYAAKALRDGLRIGDFFTDAAKRRIGNETEFILQNAAFETIQSCVCDTNSLLYDAISNNASILLEGAQGTMLDIDHGTYPHVTSCTTTINGLLAGAGLNPFQLSKVIGVFKAYATRVGEGSFPSEMDPHVDAIIRAKGREFGSTTGRSRRCGWLDLLALRYAIAHNGVRELFLTKLDILDELSTINVVIGYRINGKITATFPSRTLELECAEPVYKEFKGWKAPLSSCRAYCRLPKEARDYIKFIEQECNVPVALISVGPRPQDTIQRRPNTFGTK